jgi:type IV secretory pathway TraG/TraD family ATPase VirD4
MTFEGFFSFVPEVSLFCGLLLVGLVVISPMGRYLKTGFLVVCLPLFYANYIHFSGASTTIIHEILTGFQRPSLGSSGPVLAGYFAWIGRILSKKEFQIPLLLSLTTGFAVYQFARSINRRFFLTSPWIQAAVEIFFGLLSLYITHGLIIVPIIISNVLSWTRDSQINEKVLSGKAAIRDMYAGLLVAKLRFMALRKNGIYIHPLLRIPRSYENRGIIIFGAPGSGKTYIIMTHFLPQFRRRRDRIVAFDYKGDFTQHMGEDDDVLIISPLDARSVIWDIARDIDTEAKAWEFASMVVQKGDSVDDGVFEDWSKDLLTACLVQLQVEQKGDWGFAEFYRNSQDLERLIDAVSKYRKECEFTANFTGESRQFEAIKGTIRRCMVRLEPLVRAWGDRRQKERLFSLDEWINMPSVVKTTLLIRYDPLYSETIGPWVSNFLNQAITIILSRPDAKGKFKDFVTWFLLDEAQQLPYIPKLFEAGRAGRSKGLRLFLGTQDVGRFDTLYKDDGARETLLNLIGFKLVGHLGSEGMQTFAAGLLSKNHIQVRKQNPQSGKRGGVSYSIENRYEPAIAPGEFGAIPIPTSYNGSIFWLVHQGWNPVMLRYITPFIRDKYEAKIDAKWLSDKDRSWNQPASVTPPEDAAADKEKAKSVASAGASSVSAEAGDKGQEADAGQGKPEPESKSKKPGKSSGSGKVGIASSLTTED